jgi:AraC family transcriptional regulator of arabinose operon
MRPVNELVTGHFVRGRGYENWRTHGTDDWLLIYTIAGLGRFGHSGGGDLIARPHDFVLISPGTRHDYGVEATREHWSLLWVHFHPRPQWLEWLRWPEVSPGLMRLRFEADGMSRRPVVARLHDVHKLASGPLVRRETFAMNALEEVLLWCDAVNPQAAKFMRLDARVRTAMEVLYQRLGERLPQRELAEACGLSVSRLGNLFQQQVGTTLRRYHETLQMNRAVQLLDTTLLSVKEIAAQVGFENPFYFTLRFKRYTSKSPREYRRSAAKVPRKPGKGENG